ncbi:hypothetical protein BLNAU_6022 [Blattamonas nauphoetae]|uniref:Uncharacterized protein n=1 Tax=Blattamonas nauphoetae TaxID=2049346 RepID=A0ABQ9Y5H7_9EUKA|nr:hypothetical protein BLNAU_6022 [Blattamonas nauphoetae]
MRPSVSSETVDPPENEVFSSALFIVVFALSSSSIASDSRTARKDGQLDDERWSKTGADAIELFDEDFIIKTGNTFTLRQRPENEQTNFIPKTLFSPIISSDVAQLSFTITHSYFGYFIGVVSPHLVDFGTQDDVFDEEHGTATWGEDYTPPAPAQANAAPPLQQIQQLVIEADCRERRQTLKTLENGKVNPGFYSDLSLPFRFAITLRHPSVSVTIHSLSFTAKPTLKGGAMPSNFLE